MEYQWKCWDCDILSERDYNPGKAPKRIRCPECNKLIEKIAIINGSANSLTGEISTLDCDLVLVGEIGYHNSIEISETGKIVAVLGHGTSEKWAIDDMYDHLNDFSSGNNMALEIIKSKEGYWVWRYDIG